MTSQEFEQLAGRPASASNDRRLVRVAVASDFIIEMMKRSFVITRKGTRVIRGIPSDAQFVGCYTDYDDYLPEISSVERGNVLRSFIPNPYRVTSYFIFRHPEFEIVPEVSEIPIFMVTFGAIHEFESPLLKLLDSLTSFFIENGVK